MYAAYMVLVGAWLLASFHPLNALAMATTVGLLIWVARIEERELLSGSEYQTYCRNVRYRFIPGVY